MRVETKDNDHVQYWWCDNCGYETLCAASAELDTVYDSREHAVVIVTVTCGKCGGTVKRRRGVVNLQ